MTMRMLVDATHSEETRVVVVSGNRLEELDFEISSRKQLKGNIYLAKVVRVEPSLQAAFVEYGGNRHGFLAFSEIHPDYYRIPIADREALIAQEEALADDRDASEPAAGHEERRGARVGGAAGHDDEAAPAHDHHDEDGGGAGHAPAGNGEAGTVELVGGDDIDEAQRRRPRPIRSYKIQEVIKRRQILLVQVTKEERGNKGAALTTYLSLAGRYCVLMPNTGRGGGISRKITNPQDRKRLKELLGDLDVPAGMAIILRTAGLERSKAEIRRDLEYLLRLWDNIREETLKSTAPALIYEEADLIKRSIRDLYSNDITEIQVEGDEAYRAAKDFMRMLMPSHAKKVQPYKDETIPLFFRYQVESQIDAIHSPTCQLKSGGYIVINPTEALVSIDVNSGRSTRERNIEETAFKTNLEAAEEIARQLRLRDLAGLIVIDFIDMEDARNDAAVERRLKEAMKSDRARIQVGRISAFGLLELSRQRLRPSLVETNFERCRHCAGVGVIRSTESTALHVLRAIEEEGIRQRSSEITVTVPTVIALYILNQKRQSLAAIENRYGFRVLVNSDDALIPPDHRLERLKARSAESDAVTAPVDAERIFAETDRELEAEAADDHIDSEAAAPAAGNGTGEARERRRRRTRRGRRRGPGEERGSSPPELDAAHEAHADDHRPEAGAVDGGVPNGDGREGADGHARRDPDRSHGQDGQDDQREGSGPDATSGEDGPRRKRRRGKRGGRRRVGGRGDAIAPAQHPGGESTPSDAAWTSGASASETPTVAVGAADRPPAGPTAGDSIEDIQLVWPTEGDEAAGAHDAITSLAVPAQEPAPTPEASSAAAGRAARPRRRKAAATSDAETGDAVPADVAAVARPPRRRQPAKAAAAPPAEPEPQAAAPDEPAPPAPHIEAPHPSQPAEEAARPVATIASVAERRASPLPADLAVPTNGSAAPAGGDSTETESPAVGAPAAEPAPGDPPPRPRRGWWRRPLG